MRPGTTVRQSAPVASRAPLTTGGAAEKTPPVVDARHGHAAMAPSTGAGKSVAGGEQSFSDTDPISPSPNIITTSTTAVRTV